MYYTQCILHTHTQIHPLVIQPLGIIMIFIFINFTYYSEFLKRERRNKNLLNNSLLILYNIIQFSRTVRHPYTPNNLIVCLTTLGTYLVFFLLIHTQFFLLLLLLHFFLLLSVCCEICITISLIYRFRPVLCCWLISIYQPISRFSGVYFSLFSLSSKFLFPVFLFTQSSFYFLLTGLLWAKMKIVKTTPCLAMLFGQRLIYIWTSNLVMASYV